MEIASCGNGRLQHIAPDRARGSKFQEGFQFIYIDRIKSPVFALIWLEVLGLAGQPSILTPTIHARENEVPEQHTYKRLEAKILLQNTSRHNAKRDRYTRICTDSEAAHLQHHQLCFEARLLADMAQL